MTDKESTITMQGIMFAYNFDDFVKHAGKKCPCRLEDTEDNKCMCKDFRDNARCICGLFTQI